MYCGWDIYSAVRCVFSGLHTEKNEKIRIHPFFVCFYASVVSRSRNFVSDGNGRFFSA